MKQMINFLRILEVYLKGGLILLDKNNFITYCNKKAGLILKINPDNLFGHHAESIGFKKLTRVLNLNSLKDEIIEIEEESTKIILALLDNDGNKVILLNQPFLNSEYIIDEKVLKSLDSILNSAYDGIYVMDGQGIVVYINSAWEKMTGLKREDVIGSKTDMMKKYFSKPVFSEVVKKRDTVTVMNETPTGRKLLTTGCPVFDENKEICWVVLNVRDITELVELKEQLEIESRLSNGYRGELAKLNREALKDIVINSKKMNEIVDFCYDIAHSDTNILITGETGVGKEVIARLIHNLSNRNQAPFIKVNCGAIPENLLESEFFGYEKGSFTGASTKGKAGKFEIAQGGTIFLDEIGEMPLSLQVKLLQAIEDRKIYRIGATKPVDLNVKIISATNRNLVEEVKKGNFRSDLYYRLNILHIHIPPLRERREDIPNLINHFLSKFNKKYNKQIEITPEAMDLLIQCDWPGNVREVRNTIERIVLSTSKNQVSRYSIYRYLEESNLQKVNNASDLLDIVFEEGISLKKIVAKVEKLVLERVIKDRSTREIADLLGIHQSTVVRKMKKYKLDKKMWRGV